MNKYFDIYRNCDTTKAIQYCLMLFSFYIKRVTI